MLTVIIPTLDAEAGLARTLAALVPAAADGIVREVVVGDGGSRDGTEVVADAAGCGYVSAAGAWGERVGAAIRESRRAPWILILPPDVVLEGDWFREVGHFIERAERAGEADRMVAVFSLALASFGLGARLAEQWAAWKTRLFGRPREAQGLILSRQMWDRLTRQRRLAQHRDAIRAIGRRHIHMLRAQAVIDDGRPDGPGEG